MSQPRTRRFGGHFGLWGGLLLGTVLPVLTGGCRPGEGDRCFCHGECRGGLVCAVSGAMLRPGQCVSDIAAAGIDDGVCIEGAGESQGGDPANPPPFWDLPYADLPKTDFAPPSDPTTDSTTETSDSGTDSSSDGTSSGTGGTSGSSSGAGSSSGTGSSSTSG